MHWVRAICSSDASAKEAANFFASELELVTACRMESTLNEDPTTWALTAFANSEIASLRGVPLERGRAV